MLPRVFDLFTQVDRSLDRAQGGLGIGLTLVQRAGRDARRHASTRRSDGPGRGSEFVVRLPLVAPVAACGAAPRAERAAPARRAPPSRPGGRRQRDAADSSGVLLRAARPRGAGAPTTASRRWPRRRGASARTSCCSTSACRGMDGYEVARRIRATPGARSACAGRDDRLGPGRGPPPSRARPASTTTWSPLDAQIVALLAQRAAVRARRDAFQARCFPGFSTATSGRRVRAGACAGGWRMKLIFPACPTSSRPPTARWLPALLPVKGVSSTSPN